MVQEKGRVNAYGEAWLYITLQSGLAIECTIDTGFNGWLSLPRSLVEELELPIVGQETVETLGGAIQLCPLASIEIIWLGEPRTVSVIINEGYDVLLGTALLSGSILRINYQKAVLTITKPKSSRRQENV